ncbi:MAG: retroviral-like aspartic protease family protein [Candidatus Omnitrophica bacterium]|nr:retroviral-like aspartic protease family protein [Candidatus Omnitrophota bacterium]
MKRTISKIIIILFVIVVVELCFLYLFPTFKKKSIKNGYKEKIKLLRMENAQKQQKLRKGFEKRKYLTSGKNIYERIYNRQNQNIESLIINLAKESLPKKWTSELKVEEFTEFILLIKTGKYKKDLSIKKVIKYITPVVEYGGKYLKNIAVFDKYHQCCFYFNAEDLREIRVKDKLGFVKIKDVIDRGNNFGKFNAVKVSYEEVQGHIIIPVIVEGAYQVPMMLDTGASMTVISEEVFYKTKYEEIDTTKIRTKTFSTANGMITCPIVTKKISILGIEEKISVAVNSKHSLNLLGMNFFKNYTYAIDSSDKFLYIWEK